MDYPRPTVYPGILMAVAGLDYVLDLYDKLVAESVKCWLWCSRRGRREE